jgi:ribonuclease P protein component
VWQRNTIGYPRLGITASKKSGTAAVRNRIKRCVREYFRQHRTTLPDVDLNVIVRRQAAENTTALLFSELQRVFHQIGSRACCHEFS